MINSWELMAGLDSSSIPAKSSAAPQRAGSKEKEVAIQPVANDNAVDTRRQQKRQPYTLESFERLCPPGGAEAAVLYTTTLRGIRQTFEACNTVRAAVEAAGMCVRERDVSMDRGFREELRELMKEIGAVGPAVPRLFVKGRYIGGVEEVMKIHEEGGLAELLKGLPRSCGGSGGVCDGCGGMRFLPCFRCSGSRKLVVVVAGEERTGVPQWAGNAKGRKRATAKVVRCSECNENGLVLCPICS